MTQENHAAATVAQTENLPQAPEQIQGGGWTSLIPMVLIFVVFYFLLIKPQEKKRKLQEQLVSTVKPGEEIITHSGIYGKVVKVNENDGTAIISVGNNIEMKVLRSAIADIPSRKTTKVEVASSKAVVSDSSANKKSTSPALKKPVAKAKKPAKKAK
jgi:preprotein translocase subunit YajC